MVPSREPPEHALQVGGLAAELEQVHPRLHRRPRRPGGGGLGVRAAEAEGAVGIDDAPVAQIEVAVRAVVRPRHQDEMTQVAVGQ